MRILFLSLPRVNEHIRFGSIDARYALKRATRLLRFRSTSPAREACVVATKELAAMDAQLVETTIKAYLTEIRSRLDKAAGIGRAADACAGAGFHEKGLEVALDMEQLLYEATTLLNAASLISRIAQQS
jgi:hypothetical protein